MKSKQIKYMRPGCTRQFTLSYVRFFCFSISRWKTCYIHSMRSVCICLDGSDLILLLLFASIVQREETYTQRTSTVCSVRNVCVYFMRLKNKKKTKFILFHVFCFAHNKQLAAFFFAADLFFHLAYGGKKAQQQYARFMYFKAIYLQTKHCRWVFSRFFSTLRSLARCENEQKNTRQHSNVCFFFCAQIELHALHNPLLLLLFYQRINFHLYVRVLY